MRIGLDIGGSKIEGALFDGKFNKIRSLTKPLDARKGRAALIADFVSVIRWLQGGKKIPVGIAMAGYPGNWGQPNIKQIVGLDLENVLSSKLQVPVRIENDARCFALAESVFGAARGCKNMVGITIGTGIGGGAVVDGHLLGGRDLAACHFGHMVLDPSGPKCNCGLKGDFESWCSGVHMTKRYIAAGGKIRNPNPNKIFFSKDRIAKKIISETYDKMATGFLNLINIFNPEIIVVGGGLSNLPIYVRLNALVRKQRSVGLGKGVKIVRNILGSAAGVYGAALIIK
jgi:predicted NBD/HSP70 family sugar kinase